MKSVARYYVWWPTLDKDIEEKVALCDLCQESRGASPQVPMQPWKWPETPWKRVHIDYFGPYERKMVLLIVDAHSKWIDAHVVESATTLATIAKLRTTFATFGLPETVVSDNGSVFRSAEFVAFLASNGIQHVTTAPYHPASNGLAERAVQTIKNMLQKQPNAPLRVQLDRALFAYRNLINETTGKTPAELMFGRRLRTRLDSLLQGPHQRVVEKQEQAKQRYDVHKSPRVFGECEPVYVRTPVDGRWAPAVVTDVQGQIVEVQADDGITRRRHLDHVRRRSVKPVNDEHRPDKSMEEGATGNEQLHEDPTLRRSSRVRKPVERFLYEQC